MSRSPNGHGRGGGEDRFLFCFPWLAGDPTAQEDGIDSSALHAYVLDDLERANSDYIKAERAGHNAVLVFADDLISLRAGYPSYFADIAMFRRNALSAGFGSYEV